MATEKVSIISPVGVRFSESQLRVLDGLAAIEGMERGEFIRHLVEQERLKQQRIWEVRNPLFSAAPIRTTNTSLNKVEHE